MLHIGYWYITFTKSHALFFLYLKIECLSNNAQCHENDIGLFAHKHALADEDKYQSLVM